MMIVTRLLPAQIVQLACTVLVELLHVHIVALVLWIWIWTQPLRASAVELVHLQVVNMSAISVQLECSLILSLRLHAFPAPLASNLTKDLVHVKTAKLEQLMKI
tara:strand:- start:3657 stop:3968 length:312 start_codon:yes stop_codon:yes gene_type:complete